MGPYLLEKCTMLMTSSKQENLYYVKTNFCNPKHYVCQIFLPSFNKIEQKMEKPQLYIYIYR